LLGRALDTELTLGALQQALALSIPEIHHSDQGVQYAAQAYIDLLKQYGISVSMAAQGNPEKMGMQSD
jgi:putative transposase